MKTLQTTLEKPFPRLLFFLFLTFLIAGIYFQGAVQPESSTAWDTPLHALVAVAFLLTIANLLTEEELHKAAKNRNKHL